MEKPNDLIGKRRQKLEDLKNNNINLFPNDFNVLHTVRDITGVIEARPDSLTEEVPYLSLRAV